MRTARWFGALTVLVLTVIVAGCATPTGTGSGDLPAGTPTPSGSGPAGSPSPTGGAPPQSNPPAPALGRVVISRTGGFAGVQEMITIEPNGNWSYNNAKGSAADRGTLSASERANLLRLVSDPRFATEIRKPNGPAVCNDAFQYTIQVGEMTASFEDCADRPAVAAVLNAIGQATPF